MIRAGAGQGEPAAAGADQQQPGRVSATHQRAPPGGHGGHDQPDDGGHGVSHFRLVDFVLGTEVLKYSALKYSL